LKRRLQHPTVYDNCSKKPVFTGFRRIARWFVLQLTFIRPPDRPAGEVPMLTLDDCLGLSGFEPEEIDAVVEHEGLPFLVALEKGAWMLDHSWGPPAIRQMIRDDIEDAAEKGKTKHLQELQVIYVACSQRLPEGTDRRGASRFGHQHH
jgi:hypothetical protein